MWQSGGTPTEVEEARREAKRLVLVAEIVGAVLVLLGLFIVLDVYLLNPSLSAIFVGLPLVAVALFVIMGCLALYVAFAGVPDAKQAWEAGNFPKAYAEAKSLLVAASLGGIVPGVFAYRTARSLHPLADAHGPAPTPVATAACPHCGAPIDPRDKFCRGCGGSTVPPHP